MVSQYSKQYENLESFVGVISSRETCSLEGKMVS